MTCQVYTECFLRKMFYRIVFKKYKIFLTSILDFYNLQCLYDTTSKRNIAIHKTDHHKQEHFIM